MPERNAAGQIWPNLKSGERPEQQQRAPSLASAMYPRPTVRPPDPHRERLLAGLRELNQKIDARLARERKR